MDGRPVRKVCLTLAVVVAAFSALWLRRAPLPVGTIRVGIDQRAPFQMIRADGGVEGVSVDLIREAAKRRGLRVEFIPVSGKLPDEAIREGLVDLWPGAGISAERRREFHLTEPWMRNQYAVVRLAEQSVQRRRGPETLAMMRLPVLAPQVAKHFRGAQIQWQTGRLDAMRAVCLGAASAALLESRFVERLLLKRPPGCEKADFTSTLVPGMGLQIAIISSRAYAGAADLLRAEFGVLAAEGLMATSLERWSPSSSAEMRAEAVLREGTQRDRTLSVGLIFLLITCAVLGWLIWRLRQTTRRQRALMEELRGEKERWTLNLEATHDGLFDANLVTGVVTYSGDWLEMLGLDLGELTRGQDRWAQLRHPHDCERVDRALRAYLERSSETYSIEYRLRHQQGHWVWVHARAQGIWDPEGRPIRLVGSHSDISRRKAAEAALRVEQAQFQAFMDDTPALVCINDAAGRLLYANRHFESYLGLQGNPWLGTGLEQILPPEPMARWREHALRTLDSPLPIAGTLELPGPDGHIRTFQTTQFRFENTAGEPLLGMMATDCTAALAAEAHLRQSEEQYRQLFEANPSPCWIVDVETTRIVAVNQTAIEEYGWSREHFLALRRADILAEEQHQDDTSEPQQHRDFAGQLKWVVTASRQMRQEGRLVRLEILHDVSDRVASEARIEMAYAEMESVVTRRTAELEDGQARWRTLVDSLPQMIWTTQPDGRCDFLSRQWLDYTGCAIEQHLDFGWVDAVHPDDRELSAATWNAAVLSRSAMDLQYRVRSAKGEYRWFAVRALPLLDELGEIRHWLGTSTDIHDQKLSEENLECAVAERTLQLAEARNRAEDASRAKSDFLAMMSHEIRTPMNGVVGMTGLLLDTPLTSSQRLMVGTIRTSGDALLTVINDILDFSKIEAGKLEIEETNFDLQSTMDEVCEAVATAATEKGLSLSLRVDPDVPLDLCGDPVRLRQVLLNLVSNALKFTPSGAIAVTVSREGSRDGVAFLRWSVRDSGPGLTADQLGSLFVPFTQADRSTTRKFGGTGLGLSISKRLVELMGGTIGAASQPGAGSTFWFNVGMKTQESPLRLDGGGPVILFGRTPAINQSVRNCLERAGAQVTEFSADGAAFPDWLTRQLKTGVPLRALLVDADAVPGHQMIGRWKAHPGLTDTPVIVLGSSGDWEPCDTSDSPERQAIGRFVPKPIRRLELLEAILSPVPAPVDNDAAKPPFLLTNGRILVADDNPTNQLVARLILQKLGWQVDVVNDGRQACEAARKHAYALILMDCQMPEMDGLDATRAIRAQETTRRTPIIALSAATMSEEREKCYLAGMDDFVAKPVSRRDLEMTLERWATTQIS